MPRLLANALKAATDEIRADVRAGAKWADAHVINVSRDADRAEVMVDSSLGFDETRHPQMGKSALPPTTIVAVAKPVKSRAA